MKTTDNFASCKRDAMRKVMRKFTRESFEREEYGVCGKSAITASYTYNADDWYSVYICEIRNEENCYGIFNIAIFYNHPEWGTYTIAENNCRYVGMGESTEILARELMECIGIIEAHR